MVAANESTPLVPEAEETVETPQENSGHKGLVLFYGGIHARNIALMK